MKRTKPLIFRCFTTGTTALPSRWENPSVFSRTFFLNIHRRAERGTQSRRALPRVDLGLELPTVTGGKVRVVDCNYEFARLEAVDAILLPYEQVKAPGGVMICRQVEGKAGCIK